MLDAPASSHLRSRLRRLTHAVKVKAHAPHCRVIFTVYEMKRLGRDAAELTALADHLTAHGLVLEMLAGPLPGIYDPTGPGKLLFAFCAPMAETEREDIRASMLPSSVGPRGTMSRSWLPRGMGVRSTSNGPAGQRNGVPAQVTGCATMSS